MNKHHILTCDNQGQHSMFKPMLRRLVIVLAVVLLPMAGSPQPVQAETYSIMANGLNQNWPRNPKGRYTTASTDMVVKVPGGLVRVTREYDGSNWWINARWSPLQFRGIRSGGIASSSSSSGGSSSTIRSPIDIQPAEMFRGTFLPEELVPMPPLPLGITESTCKEYAIRTGGMLKLSNYVFRGGATTISRIGFVPPEPVMTNLIETTSSSSGSGGSSYSLSADSCEFPTGTTGWMWRHGREWAEYDAGGRLLKYGHDDVTVAVMVYDGAGRLVGVRDNTGRLVLAFESSDTAYIVKDMMAGENLPPRRVLRYDFGLGGNISQVTFPGGHTINYDYKQVAVNGGSGYIVSAITDGSGTSHIDFDAQARMSKWTDPDGAVTTYEYTYSGTTKRFKVHIEYPMTDEGVPTEDREYDQDGKLVSTKKTGEVPVDVVRAGNTATYKDARGNETTVTFDEYGMPLSVVYADGSRVLREYDPRFLNLVKETDENGVVTAYEYDERGNLVRRIEAQGRPEERVTEYTRDVRGNALTETVKGGVVTVDGVEVVVPDAVTAYTYDEYDQVDTITDAEGHVSNYDYAVNGKVSRIEDANLNAWTVEYNDSRDRPTKFTDPLNHAITMAYTANSREVRDAENRLTRFNYTPGGRLSSMVDALNGSWSSTYDGAGRLSRLSDPLARTLMGATYTMAGKPKAFTDGAGNATSFVYGEDGDEALPTQVNLPTYSQYLAYDKRMRMTQVQDLLDANTAFGVQYVYDKVGNPIRVTDRNGKITQLAYDAHNRLVRITDARGGVTRLWYDMQGNLLGVTDAKGNTTRYAYDRNGRMLSETRPGGGVIAYAWDAAGNLESQTDPLGNRMVYTYDDAYHLTGEDHYAPQATTAQRHIDYSYNANGTLTGYTDSTGGVLTNSAVYTLDNLDRRTTEAVTYVTPAGPVTWTTHTTYLANGLKDSFTYPDGTVAQYRYNAANQLTDVVLPDGAWSVNQYRWQQPTQQTFPGGSRKDLSYDNWQRLTGSETKNAADAALLSQGYVYDPESNLVQKSEDGSSTDYGYDDVHRLTAGDAPGTAADDGWTYDAVGNRLTDLRQGGVNLWQYNADNQLLRSWNAAGEEITYTYDVAGNLVRKQNQSASATSTDNLRFVYDASSKLVEVQDGDGNRIATYAYDPFGRRIAKTLYRDAVMLEPLAAARTSWFLYSPQGLVAEADGTHVYTLYGWKPDGLWGTDPLFKRDVDANGFAQNYWYLNDQLGTPRALLDQQGQVVWQSTLEAFGGMRIADNFSVDSQLRFAGQYFDLESGLINNWFRYYDQSSGRYVQADPIGLSGGFNLYAYVYGNPLAGIDPLGLFDITDWLPELNQDFVDAMAGFGDGVSSVVTLGGYSTRDLRADWGIDGGVDECSSFYMYGGVLGNFVGGAALGGLAGKALGNLRNIRQRYRDGLRDGLRRDLDSYESYMLRRQLGKELKEATPRPIRDLIYARNKRDYNDPLGPKFDPIKHADPVKNLTDTNAIVDLLLILPSANLAGMGALMGGSVAAALSW